MTERALFVLTRAEDLAGVAGTIGTLRARGGAATVVVGIRPSADADRRLTAAAEALGLTDRRWLGDAGARWPGRPPRRYTAATADAETGWLESLGAADSGEIAADIAAAVELTKPDLIVAPGDHGDADQQRLQHAARTAAEVLRVPWYKAERADARGGLRIDVSSASTRRSAAAAALGVPEPTGTHERFVRQRDGAARFQDYGLGSRIVTFIVALLMGAFAGALLTAIHQSTFPIGDVPVPWGLIAAVLITAALLVGLRIVFATRIVPAVAAAGLLAAAALFALQTAGGTVLVPANPIGYIWSFAPVVIGLAVVLWPRIGRFAHP